MSVGAALTKGNLSRLGRGRAEHVVGGEVDVDDDEVRIFPVIVRNRNESTDPASSDYGYGSRYELDILQFHMEQSH